MVIAVEGMDGAGKTTICKYIELTYGFLYIEKPTKYLFQQINGEINYELFEQVLKEIYAKDNRTRSEFFGFGNQIAVSLYPGSDIVLDRHLGSNYYWNGDDSLNKYYAGLVEKCGRPDITIFLYAPPLTRYQRLKKRNINEADLNDKSIFEDGTEKHLKFYRDNLISYIMIDTTDKTIEEVCKEVDKIIKFQYYKKDRRDGKKTWQ